MLSINYHVIEINANTREYTITPSAAGMLTDLYDALYIEEELEPTDFHNWEYELMTYGRAFYDYHGTNPVAVYTTNRPNVFRVSDLLE